MLSLLGANWSTFLLGFWNTILCSLISLFFSLIIGSGLAILETVPNKFWRAVAKVYVEIFRNIPLLVVTMVFYLVLPTYTPLKLTGFQAGTIGLSIYSSAFIAETVRSGIQSVGTGQMEGARSNGMTYMQAMTHVVLPQALTKMIPALLSQFVSLIKDTSLATIIVLPELLYHAEIIYNQNTNYMIPMYLAVAVMYFIICFALSSFANYLSKRIKY